MLKDNLNIVERKIQLTCEKVGRNSSDITLIAVSKTHPSEAIIEALDLGVINFGENKAQELTDKAEVIDRELNFHFIGHLQTNKVKYVVKHAEYIHGVDSLKLAQEIDKRAGKLDKVQKVLLEIKTSDEDSKHGLETIDEIHEVAEFCKTASNIELCGLMTMAPYTDDTALIRDCFRSLADLKMGMNNSGYNLKELSMGMTSDYEIAIEEGATMIRVGTGIFGTRNYNKG